MMSLVLVPSLEMLAKGDVKGLDAAGLLAFAAFVTKNDCCFTYRPSGAFSAPLDLLSLLRIF